MSRSKIVALAGMTALSVVLFGSSEASSAPIRDIGKCACHCKTAGGWGEDITIATNRTCYVFNDQTCNISDPATGGVRSGKLASCIKLPGTPIPDGSGTWGTSGTWNTGGSWTPTLAPVRR